MTKRTKTSKAPKQATVSLTIGSRTWTATAATRDEALVLLSRMIEESK